MAIELCHKALAETHDLVVRFALGIEIRTALAAADGKTGQAVLENLLKSKELDNRKIYRRMQSQTTLVRSDCGVELYSVASVDLYLAVVVHPGHTEHDHSLRLNDSLDDALLLQLRICGHYRLQRLQHFAGCLQELLLLCVAAYQSVVNTLQITTLKIHLLSLPEMYFRPCDLYKTCFLLYSFGG